MATLCQEVSGGTGSNLIREPVAGCCPDSKVEPAAESKMADWCWVLTRRRLLPDDLLFEEGDIYCRLSSKYVPLESKVCMDKIQKSIEEFPCGVAKCSQAFQSLAKYEAHYHSVHQNVCQACRRVYPSAHLLELHVLETHDVMFALLADKQNMFQCLLEDCTERFAGSRQRRNHMISIHKYPANYRYDNHKSPRKPKKGVNKCAGSQPVKLALAANAGVCMETGSEAGGQLDMAHGSVEIEMSNENGTKVDKDINMNTTGVIRQREAGDSDSMQMENSIEGVKQETKSSGRIFSYKVPQNLCFGQGISRGFARGRGRGRGKKRGKHWHSSQGQGDGCDTSVNIESVSMMELSDALPT